MPEFAIIGGTLLASFSFMAWTWKRGVPKNILRWFIVHKILGFGSLYVFLQIGILSTALSELCVFTALYCQIVICFILMYPAVAQSSLSLDLLHKLTKGPLKKVDLEDTIQSVALVNRRLKDLEESQLILRNDDIFICSAKGYFLAKLLSFARKFFGLKTAEG